MYEYEQLVTRRKEFAFNHAHKQYTTAHSCKNRGLRREVQNKAGCCRTLIGRIHTGRFLPRRHIFAQGNDNDQELISYSHWYRPHMRWRRDIRTVIYYNGPSHKSQFVAEGVGECVYEMTRIGHPDLGKQSIKPVLKTIGCSHLVYTNFSVPVFTWFVRRGGNGASQKTRRVDMEEGPSKRDISSIFDYLFSPNSLLTWRQSSHILGLQDSGQWYGSQWKRVRTITKSMCATAKPRCSISLSPLNTRPICPHGQEPPELCIKTFLIFSKFRHQYMSGIPRDLDDLLISRTQSLHSRSPSFATCHSSNTSPSD